MERSNISFSYGSILEHSLTPKADYLIPLKRGSFTINISFSVNIASGKRIRAQKRIKNVAYKTPIEPVVEYQCRRILKGDFRQSIYHIFPEIDHIPLTPPAARVRHYVIIALFAVPTLVSIVRPYIRVLQWILSPLFQSLALPSVDIPYTEAYQQGRLFAVCLLHQRVYAALENASKGNTERHAALFAFH